MAATVPKLARLAAKLRPHLQPVLQLPYLAWAPGWLLFTGGVAALVAHRPLAAVWLLSLGLAGLGLGGLRPLATLLWFGADAAIEAGRKASQGGGS